MSLSRSLAAMAFAALASELAACTLDFDRFEPIDANAAPSEPDASTGSTGKDAAAPPSDAEPTDGATDTAPAPDAAPEEASCPSPSSCLGTAQTCAAACAQQEKQCSSKCFIGGSCRSNCMRTESSCQAKCTTACTTCVQGSGCGAMSDCADASTGD